MDKPKVLLCDNQPSLVEHLKKRLENEYDVTTTLSVEESTLAIKANMARPNEQRYSVIVLDLSFKISSGSEPGEEGFNLLSLARKDPFVEIVIYTGTGNIHKMQKAFNEGVFRWVEKSRNVSSISKSVELTDFSVLKDCIERGVKVRNSLLALQTFLRTLDTKSPYSDILPHGINIWNHVQAIRGRE